MKIKTMEINSYIKPNIVNTKQYKILKENLKIKPIKEFPDVNDIHNKNNNSKLNRIQRRRNNSRINLKKSSKLRNDWSLNETLM